jgi:hypothetical protein
MCVLSGFISCSRRATLQRRKVNNMNADPKMDAALEILKKAGHNIGQAHISPPQHGGTMRIWIDDRACTFQEVLQMAEDVKAAKNNA